MQYERPESLKTQTSEIIPPFSKAAQRRPKKSHKGYIYLFIFFYCGRLREGFLSMTNLQYPYGGEWKIYKALHLLYD